MTAATYDFNLSTVQSSASSMIVELQPDTTSATPGTDGRWQGGVRPRITLNWAAGVKLAQGTVNTAPNSSVDGNAVYKWVKISSTPSDLTLDTSALPTVTITDDDSSGGGNTIVYGPTSTTDTTYQQVGNNKQQISGNFSDVTFDMWFGNADGTDGVMLSHAGFGAVTVTVYNAGTTSTVNNTKKWVGDDGSIPANTSFVVTHRPDITAVAITSAGVDRGGVGYGGNSTNGAKTGTYARMRHQTATSITITRLA